MSRRVREMGLSEQLLHGADVVAILQQVGRKAVPQGVTARRRRKPGFPHGPLDSALRHKR